MPCLHLLCPPAVTLDQVVEVRQGQQTEGFSKFPYRATERHSLSLMFEAEKKVRGKHTTQTLLWIPSFLLCSVTA